MKADFVHIGYHRTASTWLQYHGFVMHPEIGMLNDARTCLDAFFSKNFVEIDDYCFDAEAFKAQFAEMIDRECVLEDKIVSGISEENISGHYWNGQGSKKLADRILEIFGQVKIVIVVRNQCDMLQSLYWGYVKHGGEKSLDNLTKDPSMLGSKVFSKLCYHRMIEYYMSLFSKRQVLVLCYEELQEDSVGMLNRLYEFVGVSRLDLSNNDLKQRVNMRVPKVCEKLVLCANRAGVHSRVRKGIVSRAERLSRGLNYHRKEASAENGIEKSLVDDWRYSNQQLQRYVSVPLENFGYLK